MLSANVPSLAELLVIAKGTVHVLGPAPDAFTDKLCVLLLAMDNPDILRVLAEELLLVDEDAIQTSPQLQLILLELTNIAPPPRPVGQSPPFRAHLPAYEPKSTVLAAGLSVRLSGIRGQDATLPVAGEELPALWEGDWRRGWWYQLLLVEVNRSTAHGLLFASLPVLLDFLWQLLNDELASTAHEQCHDPGV